MSTLSADILWHDLECGRYTADLSLWHRLAERHPGPVLDVGAGTGRVAIDLARRDHRVVALDRDGELLAELVRRAGGGVRAVTGDARDLPLQDERFGLIVVPMQMIQLLDPAGRMSFLGRAAEHLSPGGRLAAAITEHFDLYDGRGRDAACLPAPDVLEVSGTVLVSQPTAVRQVGDEFILERRRERLLPDGSRLVELHREQLQQLTAAQLESEGLAAGLRVGGRSDIPATEDHVGSVVVMLDG